MKRLYHHFEKWEEITHGMWRAVSMDDRVLLTKQAADLMKDGPRFHNAMLRASREWRYSCEAHLSGGFNRQAWMGHAGCCIETSSPEDVTRQAWHTLTHDEQDLANAAADAVLKDWDARQCQNED